MLIFVSISLGAGVRGLGMRPIMTILGLSRVYDRARVVGRLTPT